MLLVPPGYAHRSVGGVNVADVFSTDTFTGNGTSQSINNGINLSGEGGLVWVKRRDGTQSHVLFDTLRGGNKALTSNANSGESTETDAVTFATNGFSVGNYVPLNVNTGTMVAWNFRKAPKFFDVVTYTGNGSNRTIAHNLGVAPGMIIVKCTSNSSTNWQVYHRSLSNTEYMSLNLTDAKATGATRWNSTTADASVFSIGTDNLVNQNTHTFVAYLFAHDPTGVIQCGSYTGNGSTTGPAITLGWQPQYIMIKRRGDGGGTGGWYIMDVSRSSFDANILANSNSVESSQDVIDLTADGFQLKSSGTTFNNSGEDYIYLAIKAE